MNVGLVVPGFSADEADWCIPALRNLVAELAREDEVVVLALRYPYQAGQYQVFGARVIALGGEQRRGLGSAALWRRAYVALRDEHRRDGLLLRNVECTAAADLGQGIERVRIDQHR